MKRVHKVLYKTRFFRFLHIYFSKSVDARKIPISEWKSLKELRYAVSEIIKILVFIVQCCLKFAISF